MVEISDPIIVDRQKEFVPDEISFINYVVSDYSDPIAPEPNVYAELEYDKTTIALTDKMRAQQSTEAMKQGLTGKDKGAFINQSVNKLKQERKDRRDEVIKKRSEELVTEILEGKTHLKKLSKLETTVDDGILAQDLMIQVLNVHPENIDVLATESDANKIIKHVRVCDEESKNKQFY